MLRINIYFCKLIFTELWEQDASDLFQIDPSTQGIKKVNLKCGSNSMLVNLETESDFTGVMYTKGSFYDQAEPCFVRPKGRAGARSLSMRFAFDKCLTKQVIIQLASSGPLKTSQKWITKNN